MKWSSVCLITLACFLSSAHATVLDQVQEEYDATSFIVRADWSIAQTFTSSMSGQIEKIDLYLQNVFSDLGPIMIPTAPNYPITVSIVSVADSVPSGPVLGQVYVQYFVLGFNTIDFLGESIFLNAGTQYGIVLSSNDIEPYDSTSTQWRSSRSDVYSGGAAWSWTLESGWRQVIVPPDNMPIETFYDKDAVFRTYMVPEPVTVVFFAVASLLPRSHRKQKYPSIYRT